VDAGQANLSLYLLSFTLFRNQFKSGAMHILLIMSNARESPKHFMVLDAISRGIKNVDKVSRVTKINKDEVKLIVNDLISQRLIISTEKKGFLGKKKAELGITSTGQRLLDAKKAELERQWQQMQQWYNNGNTTQLQSYIDDNRMWMPMMLFSGIMNMMFFTSMMSMTGMALSPMETGLADDGDGTSTSVAAGDDGGGDTGSADASNTDSGGFDMGDFSGGDFSF
jgi:hypothetical protein